MVAQGKNAVNTLCICEYFNTAKAEICICKSKFGLLTFGYVVDAYAKERYDDFLSNLKGRTIYISEADAADISDYNDFRKRYVFRLNLKKVDGYQGSGDYVDTIYSELAAAYPDLISGEAQAVSDMLYEIGEVIDSLSEYTKNPFEGDSLTESMLTNEILESFFDTPQTEATEEQKTINRLVAERVKIREQERARYEKRLESFENTNEYFY